MPSVQFDSALSLTCPINFSISIVFCGGVSCAAQSCCACIFQSQALRTKPKNPSNLTKSIERRPIKFLYGPSKRNASRSTSNGGIVGGVIIALPISYQRRGSLARGAMTRWLNRLSIEATFAPSVDIGSFPAISQTGRCIRCRRRQGDVEGTPHAQGDDRPDLAGARTGRQPMGDL
jgi:hypothetical protein